MILNPTPLLLLNFYWISLCAVIVSSASGVFKAGFKHLICLASSLLRLLPGRVATFAIVGTLVSLMLAAPWLIASFMAVMTDTMGGIFRDILTSETPVVFLGPLYASVSWGSSLLFIAMQSLDFDVSVAAIFAGLCIFVARLLALHYNISLPEFRFKS